MNDAIEKIRACTKQYEGNEMIEKSNHVTDLMEDIMDDLQ